MLRQRIRTRTSAPAGLAWRALAVVVGAIFVWYGLMLLLLAIKVSPSAVNTISGYRSAFDFLDGLRASDFDSLTRAILAASGVAALLVFGYLAWRSLPRPYLARHDLALEGEIGRELVVEARAIERAAEVAAGEGEGIASAKARAGAERLELDVVLTRADRLGDGLTEARDRARAALEAHGLPLRPVDVTLTGFEEPTRRRVR